MPVPIDLNLACGGYLTGPEGDTRFIHGLDQLATDALLYGCVLYWDLDRRWTATTDGVCFYTIGRIVLAPDAFQAPPWYIRWLWAHEVAHYVTGVSEERVEAWIGERYGDLVREPEFTRVA